jgi:hypothetical protein
LEYSENNQTAQEIFAKLKDITAIKYFLGDFDWDLNIAEIQYKIIQEA